MRRFSAIIFLLCTFALAMSAQHIQRNYHDRSMSDVLIDLDKASKRYKISNPNTHFIVYRRQASFLGQFCAGTITLLREENNISS